MSETEKRLTELEERLELLESVIMSWLDEEIDPFEAEHREFVAKAKAVQERGA